MKTLNDIYEIAETQDVTVDCYGFLHVESMSHMDDDGDCFIAIDPFRLTGRQDEKIKLAHELGHCVRGAFYNMYSPLDIRERHEIRADRWAIKQLVPYDELIAAVEDGYAEAWELAEYFDVSYDLMWRAIEYYQSTR